MSLLLHLNVKKIVCSKGITMSIEYHSELIVFRCPTFILEMCEMRPYYFGNKIAFQAVRKYVCMRFCLSFKLL
jgi:hypothetical protein